MTPARFAEQAAAAFGLTVNSVVVIQETNNVVLSLDPCAVIAKVGRWAHSRPGLLREHAVCLTLAARTPVVGQPVAEPTLDDRSGMTVTLWRRIEQIRTAEDSPARHLAECLASVHAQLAQHTLELPDLRSWLDLASDTLFNDRAMARLSINDLALLRRRYRELSEDLASMPFRAQPIHGEPHVGNFLRTAEGLRLIDFECVCVGPIEWDLASLPATVAAEFPHADPALLGTLRLLNSIRVATWCWASNHPSLRAHGINHLDIVKASDW